MPSLPPTLEVLICNQCGLTSLPALPNGLQKLDVHWNYLTFLPNIPKTLNHLDVGLNQISILPALPQVMSSIDAASNKLVKVTRLPDSLTPGGVLRLNYNLLTRLPNLPSTAHYLELNNNKLVQVPKLPTAGLINLNNNDLTSLPSIPPVHTLKVENNNISCFPIFPSTATTKYYLDGNPVTCLPNFVPWFSNSPWLSSLPLCEYGDIQNNPSGCPTAQGIEGFIHADSDTNCLITSLDNLLKNIIVQQFDSSGVNIARTGSSLDGRYFFTASPSDYTIKIDTISKPYIVKCNPPGDDSTFRLNLINSLITDVDFLVECNQSIDVGTKSITVNGIVFPGQTHSIKIVAGDLSQWYNLNCASGTSGVVSISVSGPVTYVGNSGKMNPTVNGNSYLYTINDFGSYDIDSSFFKLDFETDTTAQAGDSICVEVFITSSSNDINTANNTYNFCYEAVSSYDPNIKTVYPTSVKEGYDDWIIYTIHFQNTGSAPAFNIRLEDTLSDLLDYSTFEVIGYSHLNQHHLKGNKLTIYYPNIMLPDSTSNEPDSKGYIQYRIKPKSNLSFGTEIKNRAHIFFDFNDPIMTNTAITEFNNDLSISEKSIHLKLKVYPNPNTGFFNVESVFRDLSTSDIKMYDLLGKEIAFERTNIDGLVQINLISSIKGLVILQIKNEEDISRVKLLVE